ncbi:MAG: sugar phosphate nucleotidyltransferase, partial [Bacteroidota bacterium]
MKKAAIIMAGGRGTRFWPRSTEKTPKQLIHLIGDGTMLQNTYSRIIKIFDADDIYIVATRSLHAEVAEQLPDIPETNLIDEPFARN